MTKNTVTLGVIMSLGSLASAGVAAADPWVLLIPPTASSTAPYTSWVEHRVYATQDDCLGARMALHYEYWKSDQDLSMRALNAICRDQATGQYAGLPLDEDQDEW